MKTIPLQLLVIFILINLKISAQFKFNQDQLDSFNNKLAEKLSDNAPGAAVIIVSDESVIYEGYFGCADLHKNEKLSKTHTMGIASMSKQFLGMALLYLAEDGILDLEKDIKDYVPDLPIENKKITIRQLVSHVSGLPELTQNSNFMSNINQKHSVQEIIDMAFSGEFRSEPGEKFIYCNTGYTIAVALIEKLSKMSYNQYLKEKIFEPLNMNSTYSCDYEHDASNIAQRYIKDSTEYKAAEIIHFSNLIGGGAIVSNINDMGKWCQALLTGKHLPENYKLLWSTGHLNTGEKTDYGLGMGISIHNDMIFYYHPGMGSGMNSVNLIFPEQNFAVTVIRNISKPELSSNDIALLAADIFLSGN